MVSQEFVIKSFMNDKIETMLTEIYTNNIFICNFAIEVIRNITILQICLVVITCGLIPLLLSERFAKIMETINWTNVLFVLCSVLMFVALVIYIINIVYEIERIFEKLIEAIADKDTKIRQLETHLKNVTDSNKNNLTNM
jgi:predicted PurR-regulated permease PerM